MSFWEQARNRWESTRAQLDQLTEVNEAVEASAGVIAAAAAAGSRAGNLPLILTGAQAHHAMLIKYGSKYWVRSASAMTAHDIRDAQWHLVESWCAYRRLSLITNAVQWALAKMIGGSVPVPDYKDILNAMQALFNASGDNPTRAEVMEFWAKYHSGQLAVAEQAARGLTETGLNYRGGSLVSPSRRKALEDAMRED
jgi:hypothetical protein